MRVAFPYAIVGVAAIVAVNIVYEMRTPKPAASIPIGNSYVESVAVMPLVNLTGDPAYEHVGLGIAESIISHLASIRPLKVISRHSVQTVSEQALTVPQLGNALNVRQIIKGTVRIEADSLHISLQHVGAASDAEVWSETFVSPLEYLAEMQEDIAQVATTRFVETVPDLAVPKIVEHSGQGAGQEAYLAGSQWLGQRTAEGLNNAIADFRRSIELDPGFAPAYADLASAYALSIFYRYKVGADSYTLAAQSLANSERALALDPNLAAGFATRGYLGALIGQTAADVAADFERATSLQPNAASIPSWRARSLAELGQFEDAFSEASRAIDLDPLAPGRHIALAELSLQLGRYDQAIESARAATALQPGIIRSRAIEARALLLNGQPEQCANISLGPHFVLHATCLRAAGDTEESAAIIAQALSDIRNDTLRTNSYTEIIAYEDLAVDFALLGDVDNALFWSARAYIASPAGIEIRILESALFDKVRDDPTFAKSIAGIRADLYERVRRDSDKLQ